MYGILPGSFWIMILSCSFLTMLISLYVAYRVNRIKKENNILIVKSGIFKGFFKYYLAINSICNFLAVFLILAMSYTLNSYVIPVDSTSAKYFGTMKLIGTVLLIVQMIQITASFCMMFALTFKQKNFVA